MVESEQDFGQPEEFVRQSLETGLPVDAEFLIRLDLERIDKRLAEKTLPELDETPMYRDTQVNVGQRPDSQGGVTRAGVKGLIKATGKPVSRRPLR